MKCNQCGKEFEGNFCTECGTKVEAEVSVVPSNPKPTKKKKPFFLRWWFILLAIIVVFIGSLVVSAGGEKIVWDEMILGEILPEPPAAKGKIHENSAEELWVEINKISDKEYNDYVESCKNKGFTVDAVLNSYSFNAFNADGYKLSLSYYSSNTMLSMQLECPMEMETISWPTSTAGKKLPVPKSTIGKFSYEHDDSFFVYVGDTSKTDYANYVNACSKKGFNIDYDKGDDYYYADNKEGWHISVRYTGNNTMTIEINAPDETDNSADETKPASTEKESTDNSLNSDFKAAMDSYENFMDEYVEFMKKYKANPSDLGLLADYADYMSKYADFVEDFGKWENENMSAAETAYYIDVQARVNKKLLEVTN